MDVEIRGLLFKAGFPILVSDLLAKFEIIYRLILSQV